MKIFFYFWQCIRNLVYLISCSDSERRISNIFLLTKNPASPLSKTSLLLLLLYTNAGADLRWCVFVPILATAIAEIWCGDSRLMIYWLTNLIARKLIQRGHAFDNLPRRLTAIAIYPCDDPRNGKMKS
jgi:hypothetical protein